MRLTPEEMVIWFAVFLLSLTVHECAHAWAAELSGDPTGRYLGRITLNPIPHLDLIGSVIVPLMGMFGGGMMFGWAKPVPFNPSNLRDRRWGEIFIAIAGPLSNVLLVILFVALFKILSPSLLGDLQQPVYIMLDIGIRLNIILAVFNMIPIPPLDGSHVLRNLLPDSLAEMYSQIPQWMGLVLLVGLIAIGFTNMLVTPIFYLVGRILAA